LQHHGLLLHSGPGDWEAATGAAGMEREEPRSMPLSLRRYGLAGLLVAVALLIAAPMASAAPMQLTNWKLTGSLTLAKLRQSVQFPPGSTFNGTLDSGKLTGDVSIPEFNSRLTVLGLPVDTTLAIVESQPTSGTLTVGSGGQITVDATASTFLKIRRLSSPLLPLNLVGNQCQTSAPVNLPLHFVGPLSASGFTFTGTTTIPPLTRCGLATPLLNQLMAGGGNAFTVTIAPPA
jgi:hypothetical protein